MCPDREVDLKERLRRELDDHLADAVVLTERMALPLVRHQDPRQVRVTCEVDPEHVVGLALEEVGGRPQTGNGGDGGPVSRRRDVNHHAFLGFVAEELHYDLEARLPAQAHAIDSAKVQQEPALVLQGSSAFKPLCCREVKRLH